VLLLITIIIIFLHYEENMTGKKVKSNYKISTLEYKMTKFTL